jgi:hypothetical protein
MKGHKLCVIIGVAVLLFAVLALPGCVSKSDYEALRADYEALKADYDARISQAQERYEFATEALEIWEDMDDVRVVILNLIVEETPAVDYGSRTAALLNRLIGIENRLKWLYAPPEAVEIKDSLLGELDVIDTCVVKAGAVLQFRYEGDEATASRFFREVVDSLEGLPSKQVERDLINLKLQAEQDLEQH